MAKFKAIISSARFIQLLIVALLQALVLFNVISGEQGTGLINIISGLFVASVAVSTIDKHGNAESKKTTVSLPVGVTAVTARTKKK